MATQGHLTAAQLELAKRVVVKHLDAGSVVDVALAEFLNRGGLQLPPLTMGPSSQPPEAAPPAPDAPFAHR